MEISPMRSVGVDGPSGKSKLQTRRKSVNFKQRRDVCVERVCDTPQA